MKMKKIISFYRIKNLNTKSKSLYNYQISVINQLKKISDKVFLIISLKNIGLQIDGVEAITINNYDLIKKFFSDIYKIIFLKDTFFGFFYDLSTILKTCENPCNSIFGLYKSKSEIFKDFFIIDGEFLNINKWVSLYKSDFTPPQNTKWLIDIVDKNLSLVNDSQELIEKYHLPFLSIKCFYQNKTTSLNFNLGNELSNTIEFIKNNALYDINLIIDFVVKNINIAQIKNVLNLNFIIDSDNKVEDVSDEKIAIFVYLFFDDLFDESVKYLKNIPHYIDIYIATDNETKKLKLQSLTACIENNINFLIVNPRGRDIAALLVEFKQYFTNYDFACFIHDKKSSHMGYTVGKNFRKLLWDNTLYSKTYIENIIKIFKQQSYIGMLVPPNVYHGKYFSAFLNYWGMNFQNTKNLLQKIADVPCTIDSPPVSVGSVFWFRISALKKLNKFNLSNKDFPSEPFPEDGSIAHAIERIFPYIAQSEGFLTATIYNKYFAANEISMFRSALLDLCTLCAKNYLNYNLNFKEFKKLFKIDKK